MINAKDFKATLEAEKARLEAFIGELNKLRSIVGRYDGKIYNKKIREAIRAEGFSVYHDGSCYSLTIYGTAYKSDRSLFWAREKENFCDDKRFSAVKFRKRLWDTLKSARERLAGIEADLIDTEKKLYELHQAAKYYAEHVRGFSGYIQSEYQKAFELNLFKLNHDL